MWKSRCGTIGRNAHAPNPGSDELLAKHGVIGTRSPAVESYYPKAQSAQSDIHHDMSGDLPERKARN